MKLPVGDQSSFCNRLASSILEGDRKVSFVVGSGLTSDVVPGVPKMIDRMRTACNGSMQVSFNRTVAGVVDLGAQYRKAAEFVYLNKGREVLNRVIQDAVLLAADTTAPAPPLDRYDPKFLEQLESEGRWNLPLGVKALAQILVGLPGERLGPVLTTNFDPLLEIAVRKAGGVPRPYALNVDGSFARIESGKIDIVHVHGFWREVDTLNLDFQLSGERPKLEDSIRRSLADSVVFVLGYGGWDDVFTRTLTNRIKASHFDGMDVMWSTYEPIEQARLMSGPLAELSAGQNVVLYGGVDANVALPNVAQSVSKERRPLASRHQRQPVQANSGRSSVNRVGTVVNAGQSVTFSHRLMSLPTEVSATGTPVKPSNFVTWSTSPTGRNRVADPTRVVGRTVGKPDKPDSNEKNRERTA